MMEKQVGVSIKQARLAAGMTQKQLAEAVEGLSARDVSEAERGLKELAAEKLAALAEALGADPTSLLGNDAGEAQEESGEAPVAQGEPGEAQESASDTQEEPAEASEAKGGATAFLAGHEDVLKLFNSAVPAVKEAALSVLKGGTDDKKDGLGAVLPAIGGVLGGKGGKGESVASIVSFLASKEGVAFLETVKEALGNIAGVFGVAAPDSEEGREARRTSNSFFTFTFWYTVAVYWLLMDFHSKQARLEAKLEKE